MNVESVGGYDKIDYTIVSCGTVGEPNRLAYRIGRYSAERGVRTLLIPLCDIESKFVSERIRPIYEDSEILVFEDEEGKKKGVAYKNEEGIEFAGRRIDAILVEEGSGFWVYWIPVTAAQEKFEEAMRRADMERKYITKALNRIQKFISKAILLTTTGKTGPTRLSIVESVIPNELVILRVIVGCKMVSTTPHVEPEYDSKNEEDVENVEIVGILDEDDVLPGGSIIGQKTVMASQSEIVARMILKSTGNTVLVNTSDCEDDILALAISQILLPSIGHEPKAIRRNKNLKALAFVQGAIEEKLALKQFDYLSIAELQEIDRDLLGVLIDHSSSFWALPEEYERVRPTGRKAVTKGGVGVTVLFPLPRETVWKIFPEHIAEELEKYCVFFKVKNDSSALRGDDIKITR
jgi:hypothetical protein